MKILTILFAFFFSAQFSAQEVVDKIGVPGPIEFNETEFFLSWNKVSKILYTQQYLPRDESIEKFNQVINYNFFDKDIDLEQAVKQKVASVQKAGEKDKYAEVNVSESPDGKEYIVDYMQSQTPEKGDSFIEYNVYRFKKIEGTKKQFLILSYSKRMYGDLKSASKLLQKQRDNLLTQLIEYAIPPLSLTPSLENVEK